MMIRARGESQVVGREATISSTTARKSQCLRSRVCRCVAVGGAPGWFVKTSGCSIDESHSTRQLRAPFPRFTPVLSLPSNALDDDAKLLSCTCGGSYCDAEHRHVQRIFRDAPWFTGAVQRDYCRMVRARALGAESDELPIQIALLRIGIAGNRDGQQEIRIGRDAQMIAVLR